MVFVRKQTVDNDVKSSATAANGGTGSTGGTSSTGTGSSSGSASGSGGSGAIGGSGQAGSTGSALSTATTSSDGDTTDAMLTYTSGLVGSATDLLLYISRPDRTLSYVDAQSLTSTSERTGDLMIVRYFVADTGVGGLSATIAKRFAGTENGPIGFVRITGDLYGMSTAVQAGEEDKFTAVDKIDAREVSQIAYNYFDGTNWQETWDSATQNSLPVAIEIILTLRNATASSEDSTDETDQYALGETQHRMIVALPLAEPFVGEAAL